RPECTEGRRPRGGGRSDSDGRAGGRQSKPERDAPGLSRLGGLRRGGLRWRGDRPAGASYRPTGHGRMEPRVPEDGRSDARPASALRILAALGEQGEILHRAFEGGDVLRDLLLAGRDVAE